MIATKISISWQTINEQVYNSACIILMMTESTWEDLIGLNWISGARCGQNARGQFSTFTKWEESFKCYFILCPIRINKMQQCWKCVDRKRDVRKDNSINVCISIDGVASCILEVNSQMLPNLPRVFAFAALDMQVWIMLLPKGNKINRISLFQA